MMYCKNCGEKIEQKENFCSMCGVKTIVNDVNKPREQKRPVAPSDTMPKSNKLKIALGVFATILVAYFIYLEAIKTKCESALFYTPSVGAYVNTFGGNTPAQEGYYSARGGRYKTADDAIKSCTAESKFNFKSIIPRGSAPG